MEPAGLPEGIADAIGRWGYLALGVGVALGVPVPEDVWLLVAGYLTWSRLLSLPWVIVVGMVGAMVADHTGYWAGRLGRRRLLDRFGRYVLVTPARLRRAETFFLRHGHKAVFFARFLPWIRVSVGPLSGVSRMSYGRYFTYNSLAALTYASTMTMLGYLFAPQLDQVLELLGRGRRAASIVIVLILLAGTAIAVLRVRRRGNLDSG
ncbi:MAG TPA: DedA family protein [Candidatus Methylomirabilis sp.]|nr:DedA family protein [Candidatus Methylomirabilis sp.]